MATSPVGEDQGRLLEEALAVVRQQSQQMRKCLETPGKLMDALKCGYGEGCALSATMANIG
jgi:vacuolar protein sorting-associated protein 35